MASKQDAIRRRQKLVNRDDKKKAKTGAKAPASSPKTNYAAKSKHTALNTPLLTAAQKKSDRDQAKAKRQGQKNLATAQEKYNKATDRPAYRQEIMDAKYPLTGADKNLSTKSKQIIQEAKATWDRGKKLKEQGQTKTGQMMQDYAHLVAENRRNAAGYSGGASGNQFSRPRLEGRDRLLTEDAQRTLRSYKLGYESAQRSGDKVGMEAAGKAAEMLRLQPENYAKRPTAEDAHGRSRELPVGLEAEAQKAFFPAIGTGIAGSIDALLKAGNAATRDAIANSRKNPGEAKQVTVPEESALFKKSQEYANTVVNASDNPLYKVVAQAALSAGQMAPAIGAAFIPGVGPALSMGIMGAQAAGSKAGELTQEGVGAGEALGRGLVSGGIEALASKLLIGNLVKIVKGPGGKTFLRNTLEQMGMEGTEEAAVYVANYAADVAARDPNAQFSLAELINSAAVGAVSGGALGAGASVLSGNVGRNYLLDEVRQERKTESKTESKTEDKTQDAAAQKATAPTEVSFSQGQENGGLEDATPATTSNVINDANLSNVSDAVTANAKTDADVYAPTENYDAIYNSVIEKFDSGSGAAKPRGHYGDYYYSINTLWDGGSRSLFIKNKVTGEVLRQERYPKYTTNADLVDVFADVVAERMDKDGFSADYAKMSKKQREVFLNQRTQPEDADIHLAAEESSVTEYNFDAIDRAAERVAEIDAEARKLHKEQATQAISTEEYVARLSSLREEYAAAKAAFDALVEVAPVVNSTPLLEQEESFDSAVLDAFNPELNRDLPEGMGAMSEGGAGDFANWQASADSFHPVNEGAAAVTAEEQGRAATEVPTVDPFGGLTSKTASTLANANITPNEFSGQLEQALVEGRFSRMAYSDNMALARAEQTIGEKGFQGAVVDWLADAKAGKLSKDNTALGITLYNNAVNSGDGKLALDLASAMITYGKTAGQTLQAFNLINKMTPSGQLYTMAKTVEHINEQARSRAKINRETGLPDFQDIEIDPILAQQFMDAQTEAERAQIREEIYRDIASKVPATWRDKFNAWRYLAMLGNPRTHIRNIFGNAGFMPVRMMKNTVGGVIEAGAARAGKLDQRTKAVLNPARASDRALWQAAWADFPNVEAAIKQGGKYDDAQSVIDDYRQIYRFRPLEGARKANAKALDAEDMWFSRPAYADGLAGYLKANGITAEQYMSGEISEQQRSAAQAYAVEEAQKATYRDLNTFSEFVLRAGKLRESSNKVERAAGYLVEGVLPFKKTPANILVRGFDYSPLGLARSIKQMVRDVGSPNSDVTAAEAIDNMAAGLTGTGLLALGAFLASQNLISGGGTGEEDQDQFNELQGGQNYALNIGDYNYTIDWLAPEALPVFVGVELYNNIADRTPSDQNAVDEALDAIGRIADPMLDMSMLQSLNDLVEGVRYSDNSMGALAVNTLTSYLGQFLPTILGQVERTMEDKRYTTYTERDSAVPASVQRLLGNWANKIPGVEYNQIPYVDAWGREESTGDSPLLRAVNNFLSPGYVSKVNTSGVETELQRLHDLEYEGMFPSRAKTSTKVGGEYLSGAEYLALQTTKGKTAKDIFSDFMGTDLYKGMTDDQKAKFVSKVYDYASARGKEAGGGDPADTANWMKAARDAEEAVGMKESTFVGLYALKSALDSDTGDEVKSGIKQGMWEEQIDALPGLDDTQKQYAKDNILFWQMIPASSSSYNKAKAAGFEGIEEITQVIEGKKGADADGNGSYKKSELWSGALALANGDQALAQRYYNAWK